MHWLIKLTWGQDTAIFLYKDTEKESRWVCALAHLCLDSLSKGVRLWGRSRTQNTSPAEGGLGLALTLTCENTLTTARANPHFSARGVSLDSTVGPSGVWHLLGHCPPFGHLNGGGVQSDDDHSTRMQKKGGQSSCQPAREPKVDEIQQPEHEEGRQWGVSALKRETKPKVVINS